MARDADPSKARNLKNASTRKEVREQVTGRRTSGRATK
jgi:hypothetical protein